MASRTLALFDFDGTITRKDTLFEFVRFIHGSGSFLAGMITIAPALAMRVFGISSAQEAKETFLRKFIGNMPIEDFNTHCAQFATGIIPQIVRAGADEKLRHHQAAGDRVIVISASAEAWIQPWATMRSLELIGTRLEVRNGVITGNLNGKNCKGPEKVKRLRELLSPESYDRIVAYGDSSGDREMFAISHEQHYKPFR
jgi:HAD superfamily hydrolase (TIGR01490 family)